MSAPTPVAAGARMLLPLHAATMLLSALLVFAVQPLCARMILPVLGGAPAVWTTCMLFFQGALLTGYALAGITWRLGLRRQAAIVCLLVWIPVMVLPLHGFFPVLGNAPPSPVAWILRTLLISIGVPFCVLAMTAPLLQRWFSTSAHPDAADPYFLYAASNTGSLVGLLAYPLLLEPWLTLPRQRVAWSAGYVVTAAMLTACAWAASRQSSVPRPPPSSMVAAQSPTSLRRIRWLLLALVPSSLSLGLTSHLSTDVAPVPLIWIVPFALYLITFIVAFGARSGVFVPAANRLLPLVLLPLLLMTSVDLTTPPWVSLPLHLATFTVLAFACHAALAADRPPATHLNEFYLWIAFGGMLGGVLNSVVAPRLFDGIAEYPLAVLAALFVRRRLSDFSQLLVAPRALRGLLTAVSAAVVAFLVGRVFHVSPQLLFPLLGVVALLCLRISRREAEFAVAVAAISATSFLYQSPSAGRVVHASRTFFGVYRVNVAGPFVSLFHGTTVHGRQRRAEPAPEPLTYYSRDSPIGDLLGAADPPPRAVGIVGLGIGSLAAYARPGDRWTFYELDPHVETLARDTRFFTHLSACGESCAVVIGDARRSLAASDATYDVLVVDAFSSDAIPVHLLTVEALATYVSRLSESGVLAFHISNRHLDLAPVLGALAQRLQMVARTRVDMRRAFDESGVASSIWVAVARKPQDLDGLLGDSRWTPVDADGVPAWTDDYSNILSAFRWH